MLSQNPSLNHEKLYMFSEQLYKAPTRQKALSYGVSGKKEGNLPKIGRFTDQQNKNSSSLNKIQPQKVFSSKKIRIKEEHTNFQRNSTKNLQKNQKKLLKIGEPEKNFPKRINKVLSNTPRKATMITSKNCLDASQVQRTVMFCPLRGRIIQRIKCGDIVIQKVGQKATFAYKLIVILFEMHPLLLRRKRNKSQDNRILEMKKYNSRVTKKLRL